jgi:hypothetical protein
MKNTRNFSVSFLIKNFSNPFLFIFRIRGININ